jgi:hypothetical protein
MNQTIQIPNIPLWNHASGTFNLSVNLTGPGNAFPVSPNAIVSAKFDVNQKTTLGPDDSVQLGIGAGMNVTVAALFKEETGADSALVTEFNLTPSLTDTNLLLVIDIGGKLSFSGAGSFRFGALTGGATLDAGVDGRLVQVRPFADRTRPGDQLLQEFIASLTVPAMITKPPAHGEVTFFEFGGFLNFGANAAAGYSLQGTRDIDISKIKLSEKYALSVLGKLSIGAKLAGSFSVQVSAAEDKNWASVTVRRKRSSSLEVGADLTVDASLETSGLPATGKEFVEALIGLRAKNWLNQAQSILADAASIKTGADLAKKLDGLAATYIQKYIGKAVPALLPAEVTNLMGKLRQVEDSYQNVTDRAIALYDHYSQAALNGLLQTVKGLKGWSDLQGQIDPTLWNVIQQLTAGTALDGILKGQTAFDDLQAIADKALALTNDAAHAEIRKYIDLAKTEFGLDHLVSLVQKVDSPEHLAATLDDVAVGQAQRLIGVAIDKAMKSKDLKAAFDKLTSVVGKLQAGQDGFFQKFDEALKAAASQSFHADFSAAYSSSNERNALIDLDLRLINHDGTPCEKGIRLMKAAGGGDFSEVLANYDASVVRLRQGSLTHNLSSSSGIKINITGWHLDFQYTDTSKVIVNSDQQIRPSGNGMLNVFTTVDMSVERDKTRKTSQAEQEMHSNFTLRFLAETNNIVDGSSFDRDDQQYLIDVITRQSASYSSILKDSKVTAQKLEAMLSLGRMLGLDQTGATTAALAPMVTPDATGVFGAGEANYTVNFTESGLKALFATKFDDGEIRKVLRAIVLSNYLGKGFTLEDIAWMFCSDVAGELALGNPNFTRTQSVLDEKIDEANEQLQSPIAGITPRALNNQETVRQFASTLFQMEDTLINAFHKLQDIVAKKEKKSLGDLEKALNGFGKALKAFNGQSQLSDAMPAPMFVVMDQLIKLASPGQTTRDSALALTLATHQFLFTLQAPKAIAAVATN